MLGQAAGDAGGKLKAVAARWASGRGGGPPADDVFTAAAAGAIAAIEARRRSARSDETIELGPEEVDAVHLFFTLASQWRVHAGSGVRLGLEYTAIGATAAMLDMAMTPALFDDIRTMESAALAAWAAK